jgi:hypothetical protein
LEARQRRQLSTIPGYLYKYVDKNMISVDNVLPKTDKNGKMT